MGPAVPDKLNRHARRIERAARLFLRPTFARHKKLRALLIRSAEVALWPLSFFIAPKPREPARSRAERIVVFNPGALGDLILLIPFLRALRAHFPRAQVALLGKPGLGAFLVEQGAIDELIPVRTPWSVPLPSWTWGSSLSLLRARWVRFTSSFRSGVRFVRDILQLRSRGFDVAFSTGWHCDLRANVTLALIGAKRRVGYGYAGGGFLLTDVVPPNLEFPHVADRNLHILRQLGISTPPCGKPIRTAPQAADEALRILATNGVAPDDFVVGIHPGAGSAIREWGDERFTEVARNLVEQYGAQVLWFADPAQPQAAPAIRGVTRLALPLEQFMAVTALCRLFICNDSGPMHVAAGLGVPVVAIFGPQRPEWFGPRGEGHQIAIRNDMWCRPCGERCIWDQPHCLRLISVAQVMQAVSKTLHEQPMIKQDAATRP